MRESLDTGLTTAANMHKWKGLEARIYDKILAKKNLPPELRQVLQEMHENTMDDLGRIEDLVAVINDRREVFGDEGLTIEE